MTVEDRIRYGSGRGNEHEDKKFPVGMRVLAVDDDPTCLKMLEGLLRRCEYHVTTTNQAIKALNMLREKKDWFDLVISDVHMPDMDGFKLLELVGLEMDLPVIMLSANSDPNSVMKGINHGACDYLLKPVRLEELKNIWMHVYRKRNKETSSHNNCDDYEDCDRNYAVNSSEAGSGVVAVPGGGGGGGSDRVVVSSSKLNRKRQKDQYQDEDDDIGDFDDNGGGHENDDSSAQNKKPRVVWSVELHKKFVQAVNQLGLDKAMPKKILDLMNVDKLTRENVASHLQKYRLYLKRIHDQKQQESLAVALSARGAASYLPMGQLHVAARNYHGFSAAAAAGHHLPASMQLTPFHQQAAAAALGRMNSMNCSGAAAAYGIGSSGAGGGMMQLGRTQSSIPNSSHFQDLGRLPQINFGGNPRPNLLQGIPTSLESNQLLNDRILLQQNSIASSSSFPDPDMSFTDMGNSFNLAASNNSLILPNQQQQSLQPSNGFGGQISTELPSLSTNLFEIGARASSNLPALDSCNTSWQGGAAPLTAGYPTNMSPISACDLGNTLSSVSLAPDNNINNIVHPGNSVTSTLSDSMINQTIPLEGNTIIHASISGDSTNFLNASNTGNHLASGWNEQRSRTLVGLFQSPQPGSTLTTVSSIPNVSPQGFDNGLFETNTASMPPMDDQSRFAVDDLPYSQNMGQQGFTPQSHLKSRDEYTVMNDANNLAHVNMFEELMNATYFLPDNDGGLTGGRCM